MLVVTGVLSGTYIITVTYGGLSNQGKLAVPNAFAVTIDVDVPNPNFTVVLSGGSASTDGISANASVTNAQTPYTDIKIIGEAFNSLGQTRSDRHTGLGRGKWNYADFRPI